MARPLLVLLVVAASYGLCNGVRLIVPTSYGSVLGHAFISSWTNKTVYAFQGIPYAAPPVGDRRFKDPVRPEQWLHIKDCTKDKPSCMQTDDPVLKQLHHRMRTSEDCLYLNVYTPKIRPKSLMPVMVWLHGGVFKEGSGSRFQYGPDFLVADGVVVVTLNYRLGALGFLTLGTSEVSGNAGLKDQRLALQWIQREIGLFGGDAERVTLFGESAGSVSVHLHYLSPLSKGLFHQVIGGITASLKWGFRENGTSYGLRLASLLNCSTEDLSVTQQCLRTVSAEDILRAQGQVSFPDGDVFEDLGLVFVPTVDKASKEPFIPDLPRNMMEQKLGSFVPFLMGYTGQEGILKVSRDLDEPYTNITINMGFLTPLDKRNTGSASKIQTLIEKVVTPSIEHVGGSRGFSTMNEYFFYLYTTVCIKEYIKRGPLYVYGFRLHGNFAEIPAKFVEGNYSITGVSHAPETKYLFVLGKANQTSAVDSKERVTWKRIVRLWTNFAKFGTPTEEDDSLLENVQWEPTGEDWTYLNYLLIKDNLSMQKRFFFGRCIPI